MKQYLSILLSLLLVGSAYAQAPIGDTIYWDKDWKMTTRQHHEYYRTSKLDTVTMAPMRLVKIIDHYKDGKVQMDGYVLAEDTSKNVGLHRWFKANGDLSESYLHDYKNSRFFFESYAPYIKKADVCDSADVDLRITFFKNGKINTMSYIPSSNRPDTCACKRVCTYREYNPFSKRMYETWEFKNGIREGYYRLYYSTGILCEEGYYKSGKKTDWKRVYRYNGSLKKEKGTAPKQ